MATISLSKGQRISLKKVSPGLVKGIIGLGWDTNQYDGGYEFDLDVSLFLCGSNGKVEKDTNFIFYGNLSDHSNSVVHTGDNRTGDGDGDDEQIVVNFETIPNDVEKIAVTATIYEAKRRSQNFGMVHNAYIRVLNEESNDEILRYDLGEDFSVETALVVGEFYKKDEEWRFNAVGSGFEGGLAALCQTYGLDVEEE